MKLIQSILFIAFTLAILLTSCADDKANEVTMPHNIISVKKGILMKETYENGVQRIIENSRENGSYQATEFAWIDLDSLKNYIKLLDKVSELNNTKITGIRIYYSQYPSKKEYKYSEGEEEQLLPGRETLFFAPTIKMNSTKLSQAYPLLENVPFSIQHDGTNTLVGKLNVIEELTYKSNRKIKRFTSTDTGASLDDNNNETSLLLNELAMFPPPKND
ncbi:hypothetical protein NHF50_11280 [Flavobacterium sp. NRK F10]|uniref:hypothetical protein n=1 Tax=Flavobacterium sp. NRK F10 TaxID=2954931 RepID=UPI002091C3F2|nr:hypothetical protein [Flavobacterium sp. NRK F10]MCO6175624.1 hypothetical protein [Flavobacterium sp. NRK F10]